ncbi:MAG TPA: hypothetical protein VJI68_02880 [Candidatus Nanoarchaeia archaeon]|nr:hypothetical protein [Candidatus Nanoarchaeia archaeon]
MQKKLFGLATIVFSYVLAACPYTSAIEEIIYCNRVRIENTSEGSKCVKLYPVGFISPGNEESIICDSDNDGLVDKMYSAIIDNLCSTGNYTTNSAIEGCLLGDERLGEAQSSFDRAIEYIKDNPECELLKN